MFVTDLTMFAENGFYPVVEAIFPCVCEENFAIKISEKIDFHVRCDECGNPAVVNTVHYRKVTQGKRVLLDPIYILEGTEFKELNGDE